VADGAAVKTLTGIYHSPAGHWVGDGFPVRTMFSYDRLGRELSPFLLLDYAGPMDFPPAAQPRGVGEHPHRGFETVTIVYSGEVAHRDSAGNGGVIGPGDVQWMTAGSGLLHEEFHAPAFTHRGGRLEAAQLWVNLPARDKGVPPRYQTILKADIPDVALPGGAGRLRVVAGSFAGVEGPAVTWSPLNVWDLQLRAGQTLELPVRDGWNAMVALLRGDVSVDAGQSLSDADLALFSRSGSNLTLAARSDSQLLVLSGEPLDEPIVGYGPFVMNTRQQIEQAFADFQSGRYGQMPPRA
jgi:redox-sensitive bicupin YhaK (pirin superfamily)